MEFVGRKPSFMASEDLVRRGEGADMLSREIPAGRLAFGGGRGGLGLKDVTDEVLISVVAGSFKKRALSELYDRYGGLIYGAGMRYIGDRTLAEDLVQDVFVSVWRNAAGFDRS